MSVGKRLEEARVRKGWSQGELSRRSGVRQSLISQLEAGINRNTKLDTAVKLITVLQISLYWLATGEDDPFYAPPIPEPNLIDIVYTVNHDPK